MPPGPIRLEVDASRAPQKILHSHEQIPVRPGPLVLYYPKWIPGEHMPDGPIDNVAGVKFTANGKTIPWRRDLVKMFAFHLDIPAGVESLDADFDFLLSAPASGYSAGASATADLDVLSWNQVLLYPEGYRGRNERSCRACVFRMGGNSVRHCLTRRRRVTRSISHRSR